MIHPDLLTNEGSDVPKNGLGCVIAIILSQKLQLCEAPGSVSSDQSGYKVNSLSPFQIVSPCPMACSMIVIAC